MAGGGLRPIRCSTARTSAIMVAPALQRSAQRVRLRVEFGEARIRGRPLAFVFLHFGGGLDQSGTEPRAVYLDRLDVGLDLASLLFGRLQRVLDAAQLVAFAARSSGLAAGASLWAAAGAERPATATTISAKRQLFAGGERIAMAATKPTIPSTKRRSRAMIGVARKNRQRAIELLARHHPHQLVRPGHRAETDDRARRCPQRRIETVRAADRDGVGGNRTVARLGRFRPPIARWSGRRRARREP